jgi:hypothetical protein
MLSGLAAGCSPSASTDQAPADSSLMSNDFEASVGWNEAAEGSLTTDKAHSGRWSVQVSPGTPFSYTYVRQLDRLDPKISRAYEIRGWALRASTGSTARLVVQVNKSQADTTKVFYGNLELGSAVKKFNEWEAITLPVTLPATAAGENMVKVYLWNDKATAPTYLDDLQLVAAAK